MNTSTQTENILIVTATTVETKAVLKAFSPDKPLERIIQGIKIYFKLGVHGDAPIFLVQSEMGTATPGGALLTTRQAIQDLQPQAIIMCGIAFGFRPPKQKFGDILVSKQLEYYEAQKVDASQGIIPRGDRATASDRLLSRFRSGEVDWTGAPVYFGLILSGEKLVNNLKVRNQLLKTEREAIGGEMEGTGLYTAAREAGVEWILVKAICDFGDGEKHDDYQSMAADNAAQFVRHVLQLGGWFTRQGNNPSKTKQVEIRIEGEFSEFTSDRQQDIVSILAVLLRIEKTHIQILQVYPGSIVIIMEMLDIAANRLYEMASAYDFRLVNLGVKSVSVEGQEKIELTDRTDRIETGRVSTKIQETNWQLPGHSHEPQITGNSTSTQVQSPALAMARRALAILEQKAAGYTSLAMPLDLQIALEDKRREVAQMEGASNSTSQPQRSSTTSRSVRLNHQQQAAFEDALLSAFPSKSALTQMLRYQLGKNLEAIAGGDSLKTVVFNLIETAQAQGWIEDLIVGARKENPGNPNLADFCRQIGVDV